MVLRPGPERFCRGQLRKDRHLTQAEVAKEVGLSARGYQDLELGAKPRYDALLHIADFYDVSVDWLMGRTDNPADS